MKDVDNNEARGNGPTHYEEWLPEILEAMRTGGFQAQQAAFVGMLMTAPARDPQVMVLVKRPELHGVWASAVVALTKMPQLKRKTALLDPNARFWLRHVAGLAERTYSPIAPIWIDWRSIDMEIRTMEENEEQGQ